MLALQRPQRPQPQRQPSAGCCAQPPRAATRGPRTTARPRTTYALIAQRTAPPRLASPSYFRVAYITGFLYKYSLTAHPTCMVNSRRKRATRAQ